MSKELATKQGGAVGAMVSNMPLDAMAKSMVDSGFFRDAKQVAHAIVKVQAGHELGLPPVASMTGIYIVEGKVTLAAQTMATLIQKSGKYRYRVIESTNDRCIIDFFEGKEKIGTETFTIQDATRAKLAGRDVWQKYPKNMIFCRCMSNGVRKYCPEVTGGPVYSTEEMTDAGYQVDNEDAPQEPQRRTVKNNALDDFNREIEGKPAEPAHVHETASPAGESAPAGGDIIDPPHTDEVDVPTETGGETLTGVEVAGFLTSVEQVRTVHGWTESEALALVDAVVKKHKLKGYNQLSERHREGILGLLRADDQKAKRDERRAAAATK